jgi:hypothetical protein
MTVDIVTHLAYLPGEQSSAPVRQILRGFRIDLLPQKRGGYEYRAVGDLLAGLKLTNSLVQQGQYMAHALARLVRAELPNDSQGRFVREFDDLSGLKVLVSHRHRSYLR